jgi:hypothetical protein
MKIMVEFMNSKRKRERKAPLLEDTTAVLNRDLCDIGDEWDEIL